jgi:hypothetical protein
METGLSVFQNFTGLFFCFSIKKRRFGLKKARILYILSPEFAIALLVFVYYLLHLRAGNPATKFLLFARGLSGKSY